MAPSDSLDHRRWGRPIGVPGLGAVTRSPSLVIAVACALAVCVRRHRRSRRRGSREPHRPPRRRPRRCPAPPTRSPPPAWPPPRPRRPCRSRSPAARSPPAPCSSPTPRARIRVNVPNTWTDTSTSPGISDDGGGAAHRVGVGRRRPVPQRLDGTGHVDDRRRPEPRPRCAARQQPVQRLVPRRRRGVVRQRPLHRPAAAMVGLRWRDDPAARRQRSPARRLDDGAAAAADPLAGRPRRAPRARLVQPGAGIGRSRPPSTPRNRRRSAMCRRRCCTPPHHPMPSASRIPATISP